MDLIFGFLVNKAVYIAGWKRLETPNLVNKSPNLVLKQFFLNLTSMLREYRRFVISFVEVLYTKNGILKGMYAVF